MSGPAQKCKNNAAIFKQNYTQKLFIAFKMPYSCSLGLRGNLEFITATVVNVIKLFLVEI